MYTAGKTGVEKFVKLPCYMKMDPQTSPHGEKEEGSLSISRVSSAIQLLF